MSDIASGSPTWPFVLVRAALIGEGAHLATGDRWHALGLVCLAFALCMSIDRLTEARA